MKIWVFVSLMTRTLMLMYVDKRRMGMIMAVDILSCYEYHQMFLKNERREQEKFSAFKSDDEKFKEVNANASDVYAATRLRSIGIQACGEYEREIGKST
mmetsp:Transcript_35724/g.57387  ORF Transcript_35724/g.57387 Transcript_35724/m.57387 type:complete len:99 (+) Transcript_35724:364-660(+)